MTDFITKTLSEFGLLHGLFALLFIGAHWAIWEMYKARLKDKDTQIERLAKENHEYREKFLKLMEDKLGATEE